MIDGTDPFVTGSTLHIIGGEYGDAFKIETGFLQTRGSHGDYTGNPKSNGNVTGTGIITDE
jgi:hypothetical protein